MSSNFNVVPASEWTRLWADYKALREAAQAVVDDVCLPMPGDYLYNPIEAVAMDALEALLAVKDE